jgi:hypothetical protein
VGRLVHFWTGTNAFPGDAVTIVASRDDEIRVGVRRLRTMREMRIFEEGQAERDERQSKRIARAKRKQARRPGRTDPAPTDVI